LGDTISAVNDLVNNSSSTTQMLTSQWNSESGVSIDTEMTNLMQYEKSYEASAQLITTLNEMLQDLVDMKTT
ncbi:MAG TPA: flagellar basal body rod C-terminal domain-containing protein, partial [Candidatus Saccharimonadales bacterium]|nr:flagellar basal body rod C-terminal domain-containing protein [Candidatus Saccharimonadales bacterium]